MSALDLILGSILAVSLIFIGMHLWHLVRTGFDSEEAASRTTSTLPGALAGGVSAGLIIATDILLVLIGTILAIPDIIAVGLIGVAGYMTIDGIISITPETWGLLVIGVGLVLGVIRR